MKVIACNKCGAIVQDDPEQALVATHYDCDGMFVEMSAESANELCNLAEPIPIVMGTKNVD